MAHPDLYDDLAQALVANYDEGNIYAWIDYKRGHVIWQHVGHGGLDDALPRNVILIASVLEEYIKEGGEARWQEQDGVDGIFWTDENYWQALSDIGVNKQYGFYSLAQFPDLVNDAELGENE